VLVVSRPMFGVGGGLVFWFGFVFGLCCGWGSGFLSPWDMLGYVGWDGMRMGEYIGG
jgi:hypothetical protein